MNYLANQSMAHTCSSLDGRLAAILDIIQPDSVLGALAERDLMALLRYSTTRSLAKGRVLFRNGDEGHSVVLILQGYVKLSAMAGNDREVVYEISAPGRIFGEIAVLNGWPRCADATCLTACRVLAIDGAAFKNTLARTPDATFAAIRLLSERLCTFNARGLDAVSLPAPVRLAKTLLHLANLHPEDANGEVRIAFRLSQRELGAMTGLIRESINRHLKAWRIAGWVTMSGGSVTLCNVAALRNYVRSNEAAV